MAAPARIFSKRQRNEGRHMSEIVSKMISTQALLFLYMICGIIVSKVGIIREDNRQVLVRFLLDAAIPLMILNAFNRKTTAEEIRSSLVIMIVALVCCLTAWGLGLLLWRKKPEQRRKILLYATMFSNSGNAGLPVVNMVFGSAGVFLASMYLIPPRILQWTLGLSLFIKPKKGSFVKNVLLNPIVVVVYIGFILMATGWTIPGVFGTAIENIGNMVAPLSMILLGATLANMNLKMLFDRDVLRITLLRLIILPVGFAALMKLLHVNELSMMIAVTLLAMPVASNTATITERYGGDLKFASACVSVSTLLSCVTVPLITWIVQML